MRDKQNRLPILYVGGCFPTRHSGTPKDKRLSISQSRTAYRLQVPNKNHLCDSITLIHLPAVFYLIIQRGRSRSTDHEDSLVVVVTTDTGLLIERCVGALAVIAGVESCFLPFSKDEEEPSLIATDGEATADAVDVYCFSGASGASGNLQRAGRCRSDHRGAEHQDEKDSHGRSRDLSRGVHCKLGTEGGFQNSRE